MPFGSVRGNEFTGFLGEIWTEIEKSLGLQSNMHLATQYGAAPDKYGHWKGMIGMLHRNEVDVAVADFFMTPIRNTVVDFTSHLTITSSCLYIKTPKETLGWMTYFNPFRFSSWVTTFIMTIIAAFVLALPSYVNKWTKDNETFNYHLALFATVSSLFQQG